METEVVRKPSVEVIEFVETECVVQDRVQVCDAPPSFKCPYRHTRTRS